MTGQPRHRWRLVTGRPRTSTMVLIGLFVAVLGLYIVVRPVPATTNTGNVQTTTGTNPAGAPSSHSPTLSPTGTPSHSPSPSTSHTQTPRSTPTATPATPDTGSPAP